MNEQTIDLRDDEVEYMGGGSTSAHILKQNRVKASSRDIYASKMHSAGTWYKNHAPDGYDSTEGCIKIPVDTGTWMTFMGSKKFQICKDDKVQVKLAGGETLAGVVLKGSRKNEYDIKLVNGRVVKKVSDTNIISENYCSYETLSGYRSALNQAYVDKDNTLMDRHLQAEMKHLLNGYQREVSSLKSEGKMDAQEGKMPLTFLAFRMLAFAALGLGFIFNSAAEVVGTIPNILWYAHVYLILQWNLMVRTSNVSGANYQHIWWEGDHLKILTPKQKNDQSGVRAYPKSVYANPLDPIICPVLALALWVIACTSFRREENHCRLFEGAFCDDKFGEWLTGVLQALSPSQMATLALDIKDIGSHSIRKGVASFLSNIPGGASMVAIFLRVGWSLGNVPQRYLFAGEGGDNLVGRLACGLNMSKTTFLVLPPHFKNDFHLEEEDWCDIVPGYLELPEKFQAVCPYLLASLVWHHDWCIQTLPESHPFFNCRYFKNAWQTKLKSYVVMGFTDCEHTRMAATGIPPNMVTAGKVNDLEVKVTDLTQVVQDNHENTIKLLPELVVTAFEGRLRVEGQETFNRRDMEDLIAGLESRMVDRIDTLNTSVTEATRLDRGLLDKNDVLQPNALLWTYFWKGAVHPVPEGWVLNRKDCAGKSTLTVKALWELWWFGHPVNRTPPYRKLKSHDLSSPHDRTFLSKCSGIMKALLAIACEQGRIIDVSDLEGKSTIERDQVFTDAFNELNKKLYDIHGRQSRRVGELKIITYYNDIQKLKKL
jgi:hypothetical protein